MNPFKKYYVFEAHKNGKRTLSVKDFWFWKTFDEAYKKVELEFKAYGFIVSNFNQIKGL